MTEDILNLENNRNNETIHKIYFYKDGNSPWYRAYELSAYYACFYPNGLTESNRLHAVRKTSRLNENGVICVGLQLTSFKKYFPNVEITSVTDKQFVIELNDNDYCNISVDNYKDVYLDWKNKIELKRAKSEKLVEKESNRNIYNSPSSFSGIMKEIIRYDTHNKKEDDLRKFIGILKEMCAELI